MLPVKPGGRREGDEELGAVGVGPSVRHRQHPCPRVLEVWGDLILEFTSSHTTDK